MSKIVQTMRAADPRWKISGALILLILVLMTAAMVIPRHVWAAANTYAGNVIAAMNPSNEARMLVCDSSDYLKVNVAAGTVSITDPYSYTDGASATSSQGKLILGSDGSNLQSVKTDNTGAVQVDIESSIPAGTNAIGKLAANDGVDIGNVDVASMADFLSAGDAIAGEKGAAILGSDGANFRLFASDADGHFQVDALSLPALAAGSNNIGDVDIASLPAGNLGQQLAAASLSVVPGSDIADGTYVGDIKFGEALPAGTNAIGKLAANSGVDIGDVDVTSLSAAQLPAALGQAAMAASMSVVIASDQSDVPVAVKSDDSLVADGAVAGAQLARIMAGSDGTNLQWLKCDANGLLEVINSAYIQAGDAIAGAYGPVVAGSDGANFRWLKVDSDGNLQVDILAELPAGTQNIGDVDIASIAAGTNNIGDVDVASIAAGTNYIGKVRATDGTTDEVFPTATFAVGGASPQTLIAAGAGGEKHRIVKMTISADTAGLITISDGIGTFYLGANQSVQICFDPIGRQQTTAATAITMTNAGGGNVTAAGTYLTQ